MDNGLTLESVNIEIESNSKKAASSIDSLTKSIEKLKNITPESNNLLLELSNTIENISKSFNNISKSDSAINKAQNSLRKLKNTATTFKDTKIVGGLSNGTIESVYSGLSVFETFKVKTKNTFDNVSQRITKKLNNAFDIVKQHWTKGDLSKWLKVGALIATITRLSKAIAGFVQKSADYISNLNYFNTTLGSMKTEAKSFVDTMENDFYLDPANIMEYTANFNSLIKGFGIAEEEAYKMSKNLTQLSYDLAAFKGISVEDAMQKLKSGISGELEPMRAIGVALDQNTLQETANTLGIKKRVAQMSRAQKTELLYYQTMKSTADAQNYFARTLARVGTTAQGTEKLIINPSTAISILKEQFSRLGREIGNVFIPILMSLVPYVMAATQALADFAKKIASAFGFDIKDYDFSSTAKNVAGGISAIGDEADTTAKKVKGMLAPFDELNTIDFGNKGGNGADYIAGGSLGIEMPDYSWTKNSDLTKRVEEIKNTFNDILPMITSIGAAILTWKVGSGIVNFLNQLKFLTSKEDGLRFVLNLAIIVGGLLMAIEGTVKALSGESTIPSMLQTIFGSTAAITAVGTLFKISIPAMLSIALPMTIVFTMLVSIIGWWNKYFEDQKKEIYGDKKELDLGEFVTVSFSAIGKGLSKALDLIFPNITKAYVEYFKENKIAFDWLGAGLEILTLGLADTHMDPNVNLGVRKMLEDFWATVWKNLKSIGEGIGDYFQNYFTKNIEYYFNGVGEKLSNFFVNIRVNFLKALKEIVKYLPGVGDSWSKGIDKEIQKIQLETLPKIDKQAQTFAVNANFTLEKNIDSSGAAKKAADTFEQGMNSYKKETELLVEDYAKNINAHIAGPIDSTNAGNKLITTFNQGINSIKTTSYSLVESHAENANTVLTNNANGESAGFKTLTSFNDGLKSLKELNIIDKTLQDVGNKAKTTFKKSTNTTSIGNNIISGLNTGMKQSSVSGSSLWNTIGNIGRNILSGFKAALGIHSPSRLMREQVGKFIPLGIAKGIEDESGSIYNEIDKISDEIGNRNISDLSSIMDINYDDINGQIQTKSEVVSNLNSLDFANRVGEFCYNAITQGFSDNPQNVNVNIGDREVYSGYGEYQNRQANKYGTSVINI